MIRRFINLLFHTPWASFFLVIVGALAFSSCNGGSSAPPPPPPAPAITSVAVSPTTAILLVKAPQQFTVNVQGTGEFNPAVTWLVNNVPGGNSSVGTIISSGLYTAPSSVPSPNNVTVTAQSIQDSTKSGVSAVTINPENVKVSISPPSSSAQLGATLQFTATVTGTVNAAVFWSVNTFVGGRTSIGLIDGNGNYTAPPNLPPNNQVTVTATSQEDTTKSASAAVTILATAGGITVTISPQNPSVVFDGSQSIQFTPSVSGTTNTAVTWTADNNGGPSAGNITASGLFTPLAFDCSNVVPSTTIRAISVANPGAQAVTTVNLIPPSPTISTISPQSASVESAIQISGTFASATGLNLLFPGPNGTTIVTSATQNTGSTAGGTVPMGATSGSFSVQQICSSPSSGVRYPLSQSNVIDFQRLSQLRLRANKKDLSAGESLQLQAAFLGDSTPQPLTWGNGISSSGVYTAPTSVTPDTFVTLSACISNGSSCDSLTVRLNPLRIDPEVPIVPANETLQLSALSGGGPVAPAWSILAGGGSISASGLFTAPSVLEDTGPVLLAASSGVYTAKTSVGVSGAVPGLINRILDYPSNPPPASGPFEGARTVAVDSSRAYVLSARTLSVNHEYCWIDIYDISDPSHPVWLDAAEALGSEIFPYKCSGKLFTYGGFLFEVIPDAGTAAGVSSEVAEFQFLNNHLTLQQLWSVPTIGAYDSLDPDIVFNRGIFYALSDNLVPPPPSGTIPVVVLDVRSGNLVQSLISLPLPQPNVPASYLIPVAMGNFMYAFVDQTGTATNPQYKLATYDISVSPPKLLGLVDTMVGAIPSLRASPCPDLTRLGCAGPATPKFFGTYLSDAWDLYDISTGQPMRVGTLPYFIDDINPNRSLAVSGDLVVDVSVPAASKATGVLFDGADVGFPVTWVGDLAYRAEGKGGLAIYSPVPTGGQLPLLGVFACPFCGLPPIPNPGGGPIFDQLVNGTSLYVAQQGSFSGVLVYDLSSSVPVLVGRYSESGQDPLSLALLKNNLFVGTAQGLLVLDISAPSSPAKVAALTLPTSTMAISGNFLFVGTTDKRLIVLDVTNPASPLQVSQSSLPDFPNILRTSGTLLYIADNTAGLLTYRISNASQPVLLSQFKPSSASEDVAIDGNLALLAATDGGLVVADMTNPAAPTLLSQVPIMTIGCFLDCLNPAGLSVAIHDGLVYMGSTGTFYAEIFGFDYRSPSNPRLVSLMTYGGALGDAVLNFSFYQSEMFVGGTLFALADISQPRNVINMYYPSFPGGSGLLSTAVLEKRSTFVPTKMKPIKAKF